MNRQGYAKLTEEEVRIKVAELCGFSECRVVCSSVHRGVSGIPPWTKTRDGSVMVETPDYPNDLNACHDFEKVLTGDCRHWSCRGAEGGGPGSWASYTYYMNALVKQENPACGVFHATSVQRCEAFVLTMEAA